MAIALVRAVRGAVTVANNDADEIIAACKVLLDELMRRNKLSEDDPPSACFYSHSDLDQAFPARAARDGLTGTPLMCAIRDCRSRQPAPLYQGDDPLSY